MGRIRYRKKDLYELMRLLEKDVSNKFHYYKDDLYSFVKTIYYKPRDERRNIDPQSVPESYRFYTELPYEDIPLYITREEMSTYLRIFLKWRLDRSI